MSIKDCFNILGIGILTGMSVSAFSSILGYGVNKLMHLFDFR